MQTGNLQPENAVPIVKKRNLRFVKKKKILKKAALVISMILMLSVFLAGCGEKPVESADSRKTQTSIQRIC